MVEDTIIGIDVGTTTVKALLLTTAGRELDRFSEPYPTLRPASGIVEQHAGDWIDRLVGALRRFEQNFDLGGLQGDRHLLAGQYPCLRRRRRRGAGAGDRLAGRALRR